MQSAARAVRGGAGVLFLPGSSGILSSGVLLAYKEKNTTTNKLGGLVATFSIIRELSLRVGSGSAELACPYLGGSSCDLEERDRT